MNLYILSLFATAILFVGCIEAGEVYTSKYDNIDVDKILTNDRILSQYIKCLMDEGNCTNDGKELKTLPDALATGCNKCSEKQKSQTEKVLRHLIKNRSRDWARLKGKYDPTGEYSKKYETKVSSTQKQ
uniref:Uncharacterized protein n=1 Tax=Rhodnius prolixus TaxID=13249 RepID=T1H8I5_RHOPR